MKFQILTSASALAIVGAGTAAAPEADEAPRRRLAKTRDAPRGFEDQAAEVNPYNYVAKEDGGKGGSDKKKKEGGDKKKKEDKKKDDKKKGDEKKKDDDKKKKEDEKGDKNKSSRDDKSSKSKSSSSSSSSGGSTRSGGSSSSSGSADYRARGADLSRGVCVHKRKAKKEGVEDECDKCEPMPPPTDMEYGFCQWLFDDGKVAPAADEWATNPGLYIYEAYDRDDFREQAAEILEMLGDEAVKKEGGKKGGGKKKDGKKKDGKKKDGKKKEDKKKDGKKKEDKKKEDKDKDGKSDKDNKSDKNKSSSSSKSDKKKKKKSSSSSSGSSSSSSSSRSSGSDRSGGWRDYQGYRGYEGMCEEDNLKKKEKDDCKKMWDELCKTTTVPMSINFCDYVGLSGPPEEASLDIFWNEGRNLRG